MACARGRPRGLLTTHEAWRYCSAFAAGAAHSGRRAADCAVDPNAARSGRADEEQFRPALIAIGAQLAVAAAGHGQRLRPRRASSTCCAAWTPTAGRATQHALRLRVAASTAIAESFSYQDFARGGNVRFAAFDARASKAACSGIQIVARDLQKRYQEVVSQAEQSCFAARKEVAERSRK